MISPFNFDSSNFEENFRQLESAFVAELEEMMISTLIDKKSVEVMGNWKETIEFAGKTNFKVRLKRPNKNVWSVPVQSIKDSIKKVLREGELVSISENFKDKKVSVNNKELPLQMLLHILPDKEYENRSFVGNQVVHPTLGEGKIERITESGNVEIRFSDRVVKMKPNFINLVTA